MSDVRLIQATQRNQTLILVEGKHEKDILVKLVLDIFPEIPVKMENVHIYGTDIYDLYWLIQKEYGDDWDQADIEVNLPLLISRRNGIEPPLDSRCFSNIILMFDFERHDDKYDDSKIRRMQSYFSNATESGILYINYPMIEAYQHMRRIPEPDYLTKSVPASCGHDYKRLAGENSYINTLWDFYEKCYRTLRNSAEGMEKGKLEKILFRLLQLPQTATLFEEIDGILLTNGCPENVRMRLGHYFQAKFRASTHISQEKSFWKNARELLFYIIDINMEKAWRVQNGMDCTPPASLQEAYYQLDWAEILQKQVIASEDFASGIIWVLCTCITFLGEYKFYWNSPRLRAYP